MAFIFKSSDSSIPIQPKLTIGQPNDQFEQEADTAADQVMQMPQSPPPIQKKGDDWEEDDLQMKPLSENITPIVQKQSEEEEEELQMKGFDSGLIQTKPEETTADISSKLNQTKGSGSKLPETTNQFMSNAFGTDFSQVNIHTDSNAVQMNRSLGARAFTHGSDVYFNKGEYNPESSKGKHLLAHELTHTVQQGAATVQPMIQKAPGDEQTHEDTPIAGSSLAETRASINTWDAAGGNASLNRSHWFRLVNAVFVVMPFVPVTTRFDANKEERDAVLSVLHKKVITHPVTSPTAMVVEIPPRTGVTGSRKLFYKFNVITNPDPATVAAKPLQVEIHFLKEESASYTVPDIPMVPPGFSSRLIIPPDWHVGQTASYPGGDSTAFYAARGSVQQQIFHYLETTSAPSGGAGEINEIFRVRPRVGRTREEHFLSIRLSFTSGSTFPGFSVQYLSGSISTESPVAAYSGQQDYLGTVTGLNTVPPAELPSVNYMIDQYFAADRRNTEIDMIVPIANQTYSVYYTLVFHPAGAGRVVNATITRIGRDNAVEATSLDITRVNGYPATADVAGLKAWIIARYPSVTAADLAQDPPEEGVAPTAQTTVDVRTKINAILQARANTPAWYSANYNIEILGPAAAGTRLTSIHSLITDPARNIEQLAGLKSFTGDELKEIEFSLQSMSQQLLDSYRTKDVKMARQTILVDASGATVTSTAGMTYNSRVTTTTGSGPSATTTVQQDSTVVIYDRAFVSDEVSFIGGSAEGVRPSSVGTITHELGHVAAHRFNSLESDFDTFVAANNIDPFTRYAASTPTTEFFPEAFSLYHDDPEWLNTNYPTLFAWFRTQLATVR